MSSSTRLVLAAALATTFAAAGPMPPPADASAAHDDAVPASVTIEQSPANPVAIDTPLTITVTVLDPDGLPVAGVAVDFVRTSVPAEARFVTDSNGVVAYVFQGTDGQACETDTVTAVVRDPTDQDTILTQLSSTVEYDCWDGGPQGSIDGWSSADGGRDILRVWVAMSSEPLVGAQIDLFRKVAADWHQVGGRERVLDADGEAVFRVRDRNGRERAKYRVLVGATATTPPGRSRIVRLR